MWSLHKKASLVGVMLLMAMVELSAAAEVEGPARSFFELVSRRVCRLGESGATPKARPDLWISESPGTKADS